MNWGLVLVILLIPTVALGQQSAVTDTGEEVTLYSDGTWEYANERDALASEIPVNNRQYIKPESASFRVKSQVVEVDFWIDPQKWRFGKASENPDAEFEFTLKDGDLWGMAITEGVEIALPDMSNIALENMRSFAPDARVVHREYRTVNGAKVLHMRMDGTGSGMKVTYFANYYSDAWGTTQYAVLTGTNLVEKYRAEIDAFLNGLDPR